MTSYQLDNFCIASLILNDFFVQSYLVFVVPVEDDINSQSGH